MYNCHRPAEPQTALLLGHAIFSERHDQRVAYSHDHCCCLAPVLSCLVQSAVTNLNGLDTQHVKVEESFSTATSVHLLYCFFLFFFFVDKVAGGSGVFAAVIPLIAVIEATTLLAVVGIHPICKYLRDSRRLGRRTPFLSFFLSVVLLLFFSFLILTATGGICWISGFAELADSNSRSPEVNLRGRVGKP
ncbi:MAG: hypothetical protein BJ554DRAFT_923 [Olpidium bornovanus]|uniref:Uncharacterized protein n=1 Tax=Olpidium bornovanus TaxID=278681 RepID=A0A8H7ZSX9_9FUNG|nr:MAG: hypothetical protein BJ554DRAFT_923 [Olpidium bornovanus]